MNRQDLIAWFERLVGLRCQDFRLIAGGSLILYIGDRSEKSPLTEWRLHIEPAWRLEIATGAVVGSFDTPVGRDGAEHVLVILRKLIGQRLATFHVGAPVLDLEMTFDDGSALRTFSHSVDGENWELRHRSGQRIGMKAITEWAQWNEPSDASQ